MRCYGFKMMFWCVLTWVIMIPVIRSCVDPVAWMGGLFTTGTENDYLYIFADPPHNLG